MEGISCDLNVTDEAISSPFSDWGGPEECLPLLNTEEAKQETGGFLVSHQLFTEHLFCDQCCVRCGS